ncbi:DsbA family protein [Kutzneria sp. NPDC052558]|uniref:DsbA family protein n=1 Tax=Kutzneria sp. NPDC052558 TaxID=3364121 RepID=UPI0037CC2CC9
MAVVRHWFDFMCPFCYVAKRRNAILERHGIEVVHLPYRIHPEIPVGGVEAGRGSGRCTTTSIGRRAPPGYRCTGPRGCQHSESALRGRMDPPRHTPRHSRLLDVVSVTPAQPLPAPRHNRR